MTDLLIAIGIGLVMLLALFLAIPPLFAFLYGKVNGGWLSSACDAYIDYWVKKERKWRDQ